MLHRRPTHNCDRPPIREGEHLGSTTVERADEQRLMVRITDECLCFKRVECAVAGDIGPRELGVWTQTPVLPVTTYFCILIDKDNATRAIGFERPDLIKDRVELIGSVLHEHEQP